jgi:hypothetical protein
VGALPTLRKIETEKYASKIEALIAQSYELEWTTAAR